MSVVVSAGKGRSSSENPAPNYVRTFFSVIFPSEPDTFYDEERIA